MKKVILQNIKNVLNNFPKGKVIPSFAFIIKSDDANELSRFRVILCSSLSSTWYSTVWDRVRLNRVWNSTDSIWFVKIFYMLEYQPLA